MRRTGARQVEPADDVPRAPDDRHRQPVSLALDELSRAGEFVDEAGTCDAQRASRRVDLLGELGEHAPPAAPIATRVCPSRHARMSVSLRMTPTRRRCRAGSRRCGWCRRPHARASRRRARSRRRGRSRARPRQRPDPRLSTRSSRSRRRRRPSGEAFRPVRTRRARARPDRRPPSPRGCPPEPRSRSCSNSLTPAPCGGSPADGAVVSRRRERSRRRRGLPRSRPAGRTRRRSLCRGCRGGSSGSRPR